jgi:hypothetical protein
MSEEQMPKPPPGPPSPPTEQQFKDFTRRILAVPKPETGKQSKEIRPQKPNPK